MFQSDPPILAGLLTVTAVTAGKTAALVAVQQRIFTFGRPARDSPYVTAKFPGQVSEECLKSHHPYTLRLSLYTVTQNFEMMCTFP